MHIGLAHPRVFRDRGEARFRTHGGTTDFLDRSSSTLQVLHDGVKLAQLQRDGHLEPIHMAIASLSHIRALIERAHLTHVDA